MSESNDAFGRSKDIGADHIDLGDLTHAGKRTEDSKHEQQPKIGSLTTLATTVIHRENHGKNQPDFKGNVEGGSGNTRNQFSRFQHEFPGLHFNVDVAKALNAHHEKGLAAHREVRESKLEKAVMMLRDEFANFDEIWVVGHKGDLAENMINFGVLPREKVTLVHTDSDLGAKKWTKFIPKPPKVADERGPADAYFRDLEEISPEIKTFLEKIKTEKKKLAVLMPFGNSQLEDWVKEMGLEKQVRLLSPLDSKKNMVMEDKLWFAQMIDEVYDAQHERNKIHSKKFSCEKGLSDQEIREISEDTYHQVIRAFRMAEKQPLYVQKALSAGGDGTRRIGSAKEFSDLSLVWREDFETGIKISKGIVGKEKKDGSFEKPYPANGTMCIVPVDKDNCLVLVDPLSHKPVALESLGYSETQMGVGNDWSNSFGKDINQQYQEIAIMLGKYLYQKHGYTGIVGPDGIIGQVKKKDGNHEAVLFLNEVNPRFQGTTPYQTLNAAMNGRVPIEMIHYLSKLADGNPEKMKKITELVGSQEEYNRRSVEESGGFYIKIPSPVESMEVKTEMNGPWLWDGENLEKYKGPKVTSSEVYIRRKNDRTPLEIPVGKQLIYIKAPSAGQVIGGASTTAVGYITGSGMTVFDAHKPDVSEEGKKLYYKVIEKMKGK